jgi:hypothetical protein
LPDDIFSNQKKQIWVNFGGSFDGRCCHILWTFGILYDHLLYFTAIYVIYFMAIWYILWQFGIFDGYLVYFVKIWYIFSRFGMLYQEKSGNPGP